MCPITHASFLGMGVAVIASFIFGAIWYGPLFGKAWAGLLGFKMEDCKDKKPPGSTLLLTLFGTFLTTFVLAFIFNAASCCHFCLALLVWLGFYVPLLVGSVTWERKPWQLFAINAAFYLLNLQLITAILTYLK